MLEVPAEMDCTQKSRAIKDVRLNTFSRFLNLFV
jgi:hypothetical protein